MPLCSLVISSMLGDDDDEEHRSTMVVSTDSGEDSGSNYWKNEDSSPNGGASVPEDASSDSPRAIIDSTIQAVTSVPSNFVSDLRKVDMLLDMLAVPKIRSSADCLSDPAQLSALVRAICSKPSAHLSDAVVDAGAPVLSVAPKGLLWISDKEATKAHKRLVDDLMVLVNKHKETAANVLELPLIQRLDNCTTAGATVAALTPSSQFKNPAVRNLITGVCKMSPQCKQAWLSLFSLLTLHDLYSLKTIQDALPQLVTRESLPHWLSAASAIVAQHIVRSVRVTNSISTMEIMRVLFCKLDCGPTMGVRTLFGPERTAELLDFIIQTNSQTLQHELTAVTSRSNAGIYTVNDIASQPKLLALVTTGIRNPVYDHVGFHGLWGELLRSSVKQEFALLLFEMFYKAANVVVGERLAANVKRLFENLIAGLRQCFSYYGPGANALLQGAKINAKAILKSKPAAVKMLAALDLPVPE